MREPAGTVRVTPEVRERLAVRFGAGVHAWCDALPELVAELSARWGLEPPVATGGGGTSRVFRCLRHGTDTPVWLKLTPQPEIACEEATALRYWAATPSVVVLAADDAAAGALLLEHVTPGVPVRESGGLPLPAAAALLRELRGAAPVPRERSVLRPLSRRITFLFDLTDRRRATAGADLPLAAPVLDRARARALALAADGPVGLVHGDLHPGNVLSGPGGRLVAIDPRPAWGDPDFDAVDPVLDGVTEFPVLQERIDALAAVVPGFSPDRVLGWCRALAAVLAVPRLCVARNDAESRFLVALAAG